MDSVNAWAVSRASNANCKGGHPRSTMLNSPALDGLHKIVILNPKGGSGKTTLATNLASHFAQTGPPPTLIDFDPQGYSMRWVERRPNERAKVHGIAGYDAVLDGIPSGNIGAWSESRHVIVDLPAAIAADKLYDYVYDAHSILIPVMPSAIDAYAASRFIAELLLNAQIDRRDRQLAVIANRTRQQTRSYRMLLRFLTSLRIPLIAELRDSQNYVHAAAEGLGVCELPPHRVRKDMESLRPLFDWLSQWRMRRLDAAATRRYEHVAGTEVLTPSVSKPAL